jgi:hypothetical protein
VSLLGGLSAITIITNPDNIGIPDGDITFTFNASNPADNYINVPFNFTNDGYFELTNLFVRVRLNMTYGHYSGGGPTAPNITTTTTIFDGNHSINSIPATQPINDNLIGESYEFKNIPNPVNISVVDPLTFGADIFVSASYSLNLLSFRVEILNYTIILS